MPTPLTPEQKKVVTFTAGHLVVLAGPGSGKTHTIIEKIFYLFEQDVIPEPYGLLAITFTNAAAQEMRRRLRTKGFQVWDRVWIGTFHGFGKYLLSCYGGDIGIREDFEIVDTTEQLALLKQVSTTSSVHTLQEKIRFYKRQGIYPGQNDKGLLGNIRSAYQAYQNLLQERNGLDFDDLVPLAIRLLRESALARRIFTTFFRYVIVDEFQDTDSQQFKLTLGLANAAVGSTIVADDDQSIYGWRGASSAHVTDFKKCLRAELVVLEANFRSDKVIVEASKAIISQANRKPKPIKAISGERGILCRAEFANPQEEAKSVVKLIARLNPKRLPHVWKEIGVIARTKWRLNWVCTQLDAASIPWFDRGNLAFQPSWETALGLALLEMACDLKNNAGLGLYRVMIAVEDGGLAFRLQDEDARDVALRLREQLAGGMDFEPCVETVDRVFQCASMDQIIKAASGSSSETNRRIKNLDLLVHDLKRETNRVEGDLRVAIRRLAGYDAVQVMTSHQSKGMEFDNVFLIGLENDIFPYYRAKDINEERRVFYVSLTRARKAACLTWAAERKTQKGESKPKSPSRFVTAIPDKLLSFHL